VPGIFFDLFVILWYYSFAMGNGVKTTVKQRIKQADREDARIFESQSQKDQDTIITKLGRKFISRYRKDLEALARK